MSARKSLTETELAVLGIMRDLCDSAIRRGLAESSLRLRLELGADRVTDMLATFEREVQNAG